MTCLRSCGELETKLAIGASARSLWDSVWSPGKNVSTHGQLGLSLMLWWLVLAFVGDCRMGLPQHTGLLILGIKSPSGRAPVGLEDREPPSLFSEKHRGLGGSGLPVLPCFPLAWCGQILQVPLGLHRDPT